ncbi:MAG: peptidoglycan DD-metalloendopeptidase family protein [Ruminococcus sp.]|nr:peptidoglycan DD-metalloendopeptidase family protein [Ruminococcus sp.]
MDILKKSMLILSSAVLMTLPVCNIFDAQAYDSALWPVDSQYKDITTYFDESRNYGNTSAHNAIDIPADYGANIYSAYDGVCISADWKDAYGYLIIIWHEDLGVYTFYSHCSSVSAYSGQAVKQGDIIGYVGSTGFSDGNHLHFGICDTLLGGFPSEMYYNPLTYFSYNAEHTFEECNCSTNYSGLYTTHGVDTYLNIRNDHNTNSAILGEIPPDADIRVTKADGEWAHVEYNGITGFCSMEFLEKKGEITSGMSISNANVPRGTLETGAVFSISGTIKSDLPIKKVWGGVYENDGATPILIAEDSINSLTYDLSGEFDRHIRFNDLTDGSYVYKIEAEDESGQKFTLISSIFYVGEDKDIVTGDINSDGVVNIADMVLLQQYLLGKTSLSATQYTYADINRDSVVDVFDMVEIRKIYN